MSFESDSYDRVFALCNRFRDTQDGHEVPSQIRSANLRFLKIGVGSEASMMMNPSVCWIANSRSIWAHLLVKHKWNQRLANEELRLYRDDNEDSEMAYRKWEAIDKIMKKDLVNLSEIDLVAANMVYKKAEPDWYAYIWADCIASWLYENLAD